MASLGVPVFPINFGTLGFIAGVRPENWKKVFEDYLSGKAKLSRRLMLEARVERGGREVFRGCCLNDIVISASGIAKIIKLDVSANHEEDPEFTPLSRDRSDGLIVATPTGSTAYSVAAGGPILDPELDVLILNPICPFTLSRRPMVLPAGEPLLIEVEQEQRSGVLLTVDGQLTEALEPGDRVYISRSPNPVTLIASDRTVFYEALKTKLLWMGGDENRA
jgi:NAD+ kinase